MKNRLSLIVGVLLAVVLLLQMMVYTVKDSEGAVLLTFGKPTSEQHEPGLAFKAPWPIQDVKRYDARLRVLKSPLEEMTTSDGRAVLVGSFVLWRVSSAKTFTEKFKGEPDAARYLERRLRYHQIAVVSSTPFNALVNADRAQLKYEQVEARIKNGTGGNGLAQDASAHGMQVAMVGIRRLSLPKAATEAVFDRMRADRNQLATTILQEGKERANAIRRKAEEEASSLLVVAEKDARDLLTQADRDASPHYATMAKDAELATFLKKLEALEELLDNKTTIILDRKQPPLDVLGEGK